MSNRHDIHYGRQGGRIVPFVQPTNPRPCAGCGGPMYAVTGQAFHTMCEPPTETPPADDLFGGGL